MAVIQTTGGSLLAGGRIIEGAGQQRVFPTGGTGAPTSGTSGFMAGVAAAGTIARNSDGDLYVNTGTQANPTWTARVAPPD